VEQAGPAQATAEVSNVGYGLLHSRTIPTEEFQVPMAVKRTGSAVLTMSTRYCAQFFRRKIAMKFESLLSPGSPLALRLEHRIAHKYLRHPIRYRTR
jgi:hypothetical protein